MEASMPSSYVLGAHYEKFVKDMIASGRYNNASEVIRDALRHFEDIWRARPLSIEDIKQAVIEARNSGPGRPLEDVFSSIREMLETEEIKQKRDDNTRNAA
jgi:antitoxin ParD1/3/4